MVQVYLPTKLGDLCWANVGKYIFQHHASHMGYVYTHRPHHRHLHLLNGNFRIQQMEVR